MINAADNVQCVAVMGLSLKLPNVCLYFCAVMHMDLTDALQLERAFCVLACSGEVSSPFDCRCLLVLPSFAEWEWVVRNGPQSKMYAV